MDKDYAIKELHDIANLLCKVTKNFEGNVAWQISFINQHLSNLEYAEAKLKGLINAIKAEFKRKSR